MNDSVILEQLQQLTATVTSLQERIEDLEDLRDLEQAIVENGNTPLIPWKEAKADLGLA